MKKSRTKPGLPAQTVKTDLKNLTLEELVRFMAELGEKPYRARQIRKWLFRDGAVDFGQMTDLSRTVRDKLADRAVIGRLEIARVDESADGTRKFLWRLGDDTGIESVLIPERGHFTLCVSSQVGCAMGCRFCRTARLGLKRNLWPAEIIDQVLESRARLPEGGKLTNLVFMGMGEPLANLANVLQALAVLTDPGLTGLSRRHLSLSTVGLVPGLSQLAGIATLGLTVSLNAADDRLRNWLMPINRRYPLEELHRALEAFPLPRGRRITIAYVLLAGVNDAEKDAHNLARFLHGLKVKINLIPFNRWDGAEFERPGEEAVLAFQETLARKNYTVMIRKSKGQDVSAACGQLAGNLTPVRQSQ
ncbi:MAG: 23S rRNA (adenine(2503)-C(2))-methyltransferase RlmN [Thermodesulfobacteriota bacterium]